MSYIINSTDKYSPNFKVSEFVCKDGSFLLMDSRLIYILQKIRDNFGKAVNITSGYRSKAYNTKIGGATNSQHLYGKAADIQVSGVDPLEVARYADTIIPNSGGIGHYVGQKFVHIDVRDNKTRWREDKKGAGTYPIVKF